MYCAMHRGVTFDGLCATHRGVTEARRGRAASCKVCTMAAACSWVTPPITTGKFQVADAGRRTGAGRGEGRRIVISPCQFRRRTRAHTCR